MSLGVLGKIVEEEWRRTGELRPNVTLDEFVVMPNHFHGIIFITQPSSAGPQAESVGQAARMAGGRASANGGRASVDGGRANVDERPASANGGRASVDGGRASVDGGRANVDERPASANGERASANGERASQRLAPTMSPRAGSLGTILGQFKAAVTKRAASLEDGLNVVWQRNYYEHIIRDDADLNRIRKYIAENPAKWLEDPENPVNLPASPRPL